jgi:uncharacterized repeat protein (TIGR03803 family)
MCHPRSNKPGFCLTPFCALILLLLPGSARSQALTPLHQFSPVNVAFINQDGAYPTAGLILGSGTQTLYGVASQGGPSGGGNVFTISTDGTGFRPLYNFTPPNPFTGDPGDGAYPLGGLLLISNTLVGTTSSGGSANNGIIFKLNVNGSGFVTLHAFSNSDPSTFANPDGAYPWATLAISGNTLFGTATRGGTAGSGTVFKLNTDGTGFTTLHSFAALDVSGTNLDGAYPLGGVVLSNNVLYGTTYRGGSAGTGTVYRVTTDGLGFSTLYNLEGGSRASLSLVSNVLYGTTEDDGASGGGTVFRLNTDGSGFAVLHQFANDPPGGPWGPLMSSGSALYGATYSGGDSAHGSVFTLNLDGAGFTNLYSFSGGMDGAHPQGALLLAGDAIYGTTADGGAGGDGTVFRLAAASNGSPGLTIERDGSQVILRWPLQPAGLSLQFTTNLAGPIVWAPASPSPTIVNGLNTVTNTISTAERFYRLAPP